MSDLTMADVLNAEADLLRFERAPVEARTSPYGYGFLRLAFGPPKAPAERLWGLRLVVDADMDPVNRIEFRDRDGGVVETMDLP